MTFGPLLENLIGLTTKFTEFLDKALDPEKGNVFISVKNIDKPKILDGCKFLVKNGFKIIATTGTYEFLARNNINSLQVKKILEGRPNILDYMLSDKIQIIINTIENENTIKDSMILRRSAIKQKIPYFTSVIAVT